MLHNLTGQIVYIFTYPLIRLMVYKTHRSYVVVIHKDRVLVTKNWLGFKRQWRLPGGGSHRGELTIDTAVRELFEETGVAVVKGQLQLLASAIKNPKGFSYDLYVVSLKSEPKISLQYPEILMAKFISISNLMQEVNKGDQLTFALQKLGNSGLIC